MKPNSVPWSTCAIAILAFTATANAGVVFGLPTFGLQGGVYRWDAAPRAISGNERSLDGGLRYAVSGGSLDAFRDQLTWSVLPSSSAFSSAVESAFNAWTVVDPTSGFGSALRFVYDPSVAVAGVVGGGVNINGAEIDIIATTDARFWNPGNTSPQGETWFDGINAVTTLTSGVANYSFSRAISGADLYLNSNPGAVYTLDVFRRLLTHEIGHAIGLGDVEGTINPGLFIDDNFDATNPAGTLNNSWAALVNPLDPSGSALLARYNIGSATTAAGVDLLMESNGLGISFANPVTNLQPLTNDEFGTRQFLYPSLAPAPEPSIALMGLLGVGLLILKARRRVLVIPSQVVLAA
jgi:MYXO-CTERM domain-containing protein